MHPTNLKKKLFKKNMSSKNSKHNDLKCSKVNNYLKKLIHPTLY